MPKIKNKKQKKTDYREELLMDLLASLPRVKTVRRGQIKTNLEKLQRKFHEVAHGQDNIQMEQFKQIMNCKNDLFLERLFAIFDKNGSGIVSKREFLETINEIIIKPDDQKIEFLFRLYDYNDDQSISKDELKMVLRACMEENKLYFNDEQIERLAVVLIEDADVDNDKLISWHEFKNLIEKQPGLTQNLAISIDRWLLPFEHEDNEKKSTLKTYLYSTILYRKLNLEYIKNNFTSVIFFFTWFLINCLLIAKRIYDYHFVLESSAGLTVARCAGQCLNFNCSFIFILMTRKIITFLRSFNLSEYLPLDQHIYYHKLVGWSILLFSLIHTVGHGVNVLGIVSESNDYSFFGCFFGTDLKIGIYGTAFVTGWALLIVLFIITISSMNFVRRKGFFEIFYYLHLLYIPLIILCLIHAPNYWKWLIIPGIIFLIEKIYFLRSRRITSVIREGTILPSEVINLVIDKPPNFNFKPGDFIFVQIPEIAKREWHPFTISSAPENYDETIWLHIRACGEWTRKLYQKYEDYQKVKVVLNEYPRKRHLEKTAKLGRENEAYNEETLERNENNNNVVIPITANTPIDAMNKQQGENEPNLDVYGNLKITPTINTKPYNSTPLYELDSTNEDHLAKIQKNFSQTNRDEKSTFLTHLKSISNVSSSFVSIPLSNLNKTKACKLFNECELEELSEEDEYLDKGQTLSKTVHFPMRIRIDGPYGSPSSDIFNAEHAVLVAPGIGVTPFASILQSIMIRYQQSKHICPRCNHKFLDCPPKSLMKLKKVDFVWINREQRCFEWFVNLMAQLEITQKELGTNERFLDMHVYVTSAKDKSDMKAIGLQLALDLLHEKSKRDLITGLKTRTKTGRPNWDKFFMEIAKQKKGKVTVFYCGNPELGRILQLHANKYEFCFKKENF